MTKLNLTAADPAYQERMKNYTVRDAVMVLGFYIFILVLYYFVGRTKATSGRYFGQATNIILLIIPILICRRTLSGIGFTTRNLRRSLIVAGIIGLAYLLPTMIIPGITGHAKLLPASKILENIFFYFIIIGLSEEVCFRGFIQPRFYPLMRYEWLTVFAGGIVFVLMHYPYQMASRNMTFLEYWPTFIEQAPVQFFWHLLFTWLYRRYGNIFAGTLLHGLVNMCVGLFA